MSRLREWSRLLAGREASDQLRAEEGVNAGVKVSKLQELCDEILSTPQYDYYDGEPTENTTRSKLARVAKAYDEKWHEENDWLLTKSDEHRVNCRGNCTVCLFKKKIDGILNE